MRKFIKGTSICTLLLFFATLFSFQLYASNVEAAVTGSTNGGQCEISIKNFNPRSPKTVSTTITAMDARGWKQSKGKIYVDVYDEVGVRMQHIMIQGSGKISLKTNHKFYVLKFSNACRANDPNYYNSVKWKVDKTSL